MENNKKTSPTKDEVENKNMTLGSFEMVVMHLNILANCIDAPFRITMVKTEDYEPNWWDFSE